MKRKLLLIISLLLCKLLVAQNEGNIWCFGVNAGLDFNSGSPVTFPGVIMNQLEGCASIADAAGNLLFYTDGITVRNSNHAAMTNGTALAGDYSSTQSALIVKQPGSSVLYYVFTSGANGAGPFCYSIVDMSLQSGFGDVTTLNTQLLTPVDERVTAVRHANGNDIWILTTQNSGGTIQAFLLTSAGVSPTPVTTVTGITHTGSDYLGCLKASPLKNQIAMACHVNSFELHDFDNSTGITSNPVVMMSSNYALAYGVEFSPDGTRLYGSEYGSGDNVYQFDLTAGSAAAIISSATLIGTGSGLTTTMQTGPDQKIYVALEFTSSVAVINSPNQLGVACNFVNNAVTLTGATCNAGLPNIFVEYVSPVGVEEAQSGNEGFTVYPNPAEEDLTVTFKSAKKAVATIEIFNTIGEKTFQQDIGTKAGVNRVELTNALLTEGIYFLRVTTDGKTLSKKLTVK